MVRRERLVDADEDKLCFSLGHARDKPVQHAANLMFDSIIFQATHLVDECS